MNRYFVFLALLILATNAFAEISAKPTWADIDKCPSLEHQLATSGLVKGLKAEEKARDLCETEAKAYQDKTNCQVVCQGFAFGKTCQWELNGIKKSTKIDFEVVNLEKKTINKKVWQPEYNLSNSHILINANLAIIPSVSSDHPAQILSADFMLKGPAFNGFTSLKNIVPVKDGFFFVPEEIYGNKIEIYFAQSEVSNPLMIHSIPLDKNKHYLTRNYFKSSYDQNLLAVEVCDVDNDKCDAYLLNNSGLLFAKTYNVEKYDFHLLTIASGKSLWIYNRDQIKILTTDSEKIVRNSISFPMGPANSRPNLIIDTPNILTEKFQTIYYKGLWSSVRDLYLLNNEGQVVNSFPIRRNCENNQSWDFYTKELFVNYDLNGQPQSITSDYLNSNCQLYGFSNFKFYKQGQLVNDVNLRGFSNAPLVHKKNNMELALTAEEITYDDLRGGSVQLTLLDSNGNEYKTTTLSLPGNRVRTSSLISFNNDSPNEVKADFALTYSTLPGNYYDNRYSDMFLQSFRIERQCLDYQFRKLE